MDFAACRTGRWIGGGRRTKRRDVNFIFEIESGESCYFEIHALYGLYSHRNVYHDPRIDSLVEIESNTCKSSLYSALFGSIPRTVRGVHVLMPFLNMHAYSKQT